MSSQLDPNPRSPRETRAVAPLKERLTPEARRRQLLDVASAIVTEQGVEHLEVRALAKRAGVTRPVVYRYFPTRRALILALLEDFAEAVEVAYRSAMISSLGKPLDEIVRTFVAASCDVIENRGAGPWHLFVLRGADHEVTEVGQAMQERLLAPWLDHIADVTSLSKADVRLIAPIVVAGGRAALDDWIDGKLAKKRAVELSARAVTALLREYAG